MTNRDQDIIDHIQEWVDDSLKERKNLIPIYDVAWLLTRVKQYKKTIDRMKEEK